MSQWSSVGIWAKRFTYINLLLIYVRYITTLREGCSYYSHFADEEAEAQSFIGLRLPSWK